MTLCLNCMRNLSAYYWSATIIAGEGVNKLNKAAAVISKPRLLVRESPASPCAGSLDIGSVALLPLCVPRCMTCLRAPQGASGAILAYAARLLPSDRSTSR